MTGGERVTPLKHKTVKVLPDSELGLTLKAAKTSGEPVVVDSGEDVSTLVVANSEPEDVFAHYDPHRVREALRASQGALKGVDVDELLADLREQRTQDGTGRPA